MLFILKTGRRQWIGTPEEMVKLKEELQAQGIRARLLNTDGTRVAAEKKGSQR